MASTGETLTRGGKTFKIFICDRCGAPREDWEIYQTGWPDDPKEWCLWPDHSPGSAHG